MRNDESCRGVCAKRLPNGFGAWHKRRYNAFTLIELVVVFALILVLTGLVLSTAGYARKKGARARAETEIAALSAACESYKADYGVYPRDPTPNTATDSLNAKTDGNPMPSPTPGNPSGATYPWLVLSYTTPCLVQPREAVIQTPEQGPILCSSPICCFPPTRRNPCSTSKIHSVTVTVTRLSKQRQGTAQRDTTRLSTCGARLD